jgi:hypothetical protein
VVESSRLEGEPEIQWDIALIGPWEKYTNQKYKTTIKEAFNELSIFDPEEHQEDNEGDYFTTDLEAYLRTRILVIYMPSFNSAALFEAGYFYRQLQISGLIDTKEPSRNIVTIWDDSQIEKPYAKKWFERVGAVVQTDQEAVEVVRDMLNLYPTS